MNLSAAVLATLLSQCAPDVSPVTAMAVIQTESGGNPYVVANVSDGVSKAFDDEKLAVAYVNDLSRHGKTYSAGLMQVYSKNFSAYQVDNSTIFDPCTNIKVGAKILTENYESQKGGDVQTNLRKSLSMYYSGNETRGFKKEKQYDNTSYVERVEKKAYAVPALKPSGLNDEAEDNSSSNVKKTDSQTWDVFGDFNS
ncbi:TPA: lytic transglycosylase domain-containing protein [Escherichia coli]|uniref:lytic transglycosylase domain-containing protein n=1 Tax=Enterobacterales TaxID=91347 RepID=UPI0011523FE5|nr:MULTISPECIES: lytic transglycosylase domain-containing protein [Enterobacteriaceae]ECL7789975.1 lytic transglycosylase domain-containing protein [Salmonella enterica]EGR6985875.1 lytic transglycosylase domain-containing protein [Salmonella enterica subsp. enterica serovar Rissen]HCR2156267.1 lytic transglycosylase domain-containing protein [Enterobacter asburiae]EFH4146408.1 transglycosylase SLT domain-containing protein [Escherichia coli]EGZ3553179.1 lytic transglycosylase domain-containin